MTADMRFIVTEVEGFANPLSRAANSGLSCQVIDTAYNCRVMATFRSEQLTRTPHSIDTKEARRAYTLARVRELASIRAAELNADPTLGRHKQLRLAS